MNALTCPTCGHSKELAAPVTPSEALGYFETFATVVALVCKHFCVTVDILEGKGRKTKRSRASLDHSWPRQVAIALVREHTGYSFMAIGALFKCHHTNALHACNAVRDICNTNQRCRDEYKALATALKGL